MSRGKILFLILAGLLLSLFNIETGYGSYTELLENSPVIFTENEGQWDNEIKYVASRGAFSIAITPEGILYRHENSQSSGILKSVFLNANPDSKIQAGEKAEFNSNYFIGNNPVNWRRHVKNFQAVFYRDVYPGIDLKYYGRGEWLEYDFIISPQVDYSQIRLIFEGAEDIRINADGDVVIESGGVNLIHKKPVAYQEFNGIREYIECEFQISDNNEISFLINDEYDSERTLIIDPVLSYSHFLRGQYSEYLSDVTVDQEGNAYFVGHTSYDFPLVDPYPGSSCPGIIIMKMNSFGQILFSTCFGGSYNNNGNAIVVDNEGNIYIAGHTQSDDYPTYNAYQPDYIGSTVFANCVLTKFNPGGDDLIFSTYLGGANIDYCFALAVDDSGYVYVGGAASEGFPVVNAIQPNHINGFDAFVAKFVPEGNALVYSTYLGGTRVERVNDIAVDDSGYAYVVGNTSSSDFPTANAYQLLFGSSSALDDGFLSKIPPQGDSLVYSTFLGGTAADIAYGVAVDNEYCVYITGGTGSSDFPLKYPLQSGYGGGYYDAFITKFGPDGDSLIYSTFLGGNANDHAEDIDLNQLKQAYICGFTMSSDFPIMHAVQAGYGGGNQDGFISVLNSAGNEMTFSTYIGTADNEGLTGIAVDPNDNALACGFWTKQNTTGFDDALVLKISFDQDCGDPGFLVGRDGWQFGNSDAEIWPESWWQQFDYNDPQYPEEFHGIPSNTYPDWPLFAAITGENFCYYDPPPGSVRYKTEALENWKNIRSEFAGACYGFALSSIAYFDELLDFSEAFPAYSFINEIPINAESRFCINYYHHFQFDPEIFDYETTVYNFVGPTETLEACKNQFNALTRNDCLLCLGNNNGVGGHAIVPLRCEQDDMNPSLWSLYVYDGNRPNDDTLRILINTAIDTWYYDILPEWGGNLHLYLQPPATMVLDTSEEKSRLEYSPYPQSYRDIRPHFEIYKSQCGEILFSTTEGEIGYNMDSVFNSIPDAVPIAPKNGRAVQPYGYYLPEGEWNLSFTEALDSAFRVSIQKQNQIHIYNRVDVKSTDEDLLQYGFEENSIAVLNPDNYRRRHGLRFIDEQADSEIVINIMNYGLSPNDSARYLFNDQFEYEVYNYGKSGTYDLKIEMTGSSFDTVYYHRGVKINARTAQKIIPDWRSYGDSVLIVSDVKMDGIFEDSTLLENSAENVYLCGDANGDGRTNVSDVIFILNYIFIPRSPAPDPINSAETNCDGSVNLADAYWIINYIFFGGSDPCDSNGDGLPDC